MNVAYRILVQEARKYNGKPEDWFFEFAAPLLKAVDALQDQLEELDKENFRLAAAQCHDGYGDDHGNWRCKYQDSIETLVDERDKATEERDLLRRRLEELRANITLIRDQARLYKGFDDQYYARWADKALCEDDALTEMRR